MKRSKLLIPIIASASIAPIAMITSCNGKSDAELIAEAIYTPVGLNETKIQAGETYLDQLKKFTVMEKKACLVYDLFGFFNLKGYRGLPEDESFTSLYKKEKVSIATNITKCEYTITDDNKIKVSVLGYVSFIFNQNLEVGKSVLYWADDYVMITYDILNREVELDETNCCLKYKPSQAGQQECVGMIKERCGGKEAVSKLYYIETVDPYNDYHLKDETLPNNFKNLSK